MIELAGRVAVVTGAGSGIGRGMALAFARAGVHVVIADIDGEAAERVRGEIEGEGGAASAHRLDVARRDDVETLAATVWRDLGGAHLLCNNAGVTTFGLLCDGIPSADWDWVVAVNLLGVIHGLEAFLPRMRELPGRKHVVNTASIAGIGPSPLVGPYAATKHAVVGLSDTLRVEGAGHGISCSVLCPGNVRTGIVEADRNRQRDFGGPTGATNAMVAAHVATGVDPEWVGRMVLRAVQDDVPYVFTHAESREIALQRHAAMEQSFDWSARFRESDPNDGR